MSSVQRRHLIVVGAGAAGTAVLSHFARLVGPRACRWSVTVIDAKPGFGPGMVYGTDAAAMHLLNQEAGSMSLWRSAPDHFLDWLASVGLAPRDPKRSRVRNAYLSRRVFGLYLRAQFDIAVDDLRMSGTHVILMHDRADDVRVESTGVAVHLRRGGWLPGGAAILATGHWTPARFRAYQQRPAHGGHAGCFVDAWPAAQMLDAVDEADRVAVLGTSLTAIDAVLALACRHGHFRESNGDVAYRAVSTPAISVFSRGGFLPAVRPKRRAARRRADRYRFEHFELMGHGYADAVSRVERALDDAFGTSWRPLFHRDVGGGGDVTAERIHRLSIDLAAARSDRLGAFLFAYRSLYGPWARWYLAADAGERVLFRAHHQRLLTACAGAMPAPTARRVLALMRGGWLRVYRGLTSVQPADGAFRFEFAGGVSAPQRFAHVIDATGHDPQIDLNDSPLWRRVLALGLASENPLGGVTCDEHGRLAGWHGGDVHMYTIGQVASAQNIGFSAMAAVTKAAEATVAALLREDSTRVEIANDALRVDVG